MFWLYGSPGIGKSRLARDLSEAYTVSQAEVYTKSGGTKWWDGYTGQPVVIWDEIEQDYPWNNLLQVLDRYPMTVEVKGGHTSMLARLIIITSNFSPEELFGDKQNYTALKRRLTLILNFTNIIYPDIVLDHDIHQPVVC